MQALFRGLSVLVVTSALLPMQMGSMAASAAELVLIEYSRCPSCIRFNATVGREYSATAEGRKAPLRRVKLGQGKIPPDLSGIRVRGTPTFILMDGGREIGRFDGFSSRGKFFAKLDNLLVKLR